jgi:cell wall-associated NlpC family hydrolase
VPVIKAVAGGFAAVVACTAIVAASAGSVTGVVAAAGGLGAGGGGVSTTCIPVGAASDTVTGYQPTQMSNAAIIVAVGTQLGVPTQGEVIAIATSLQESGLENLDHGDRDSLGLFQQRPSQGWGTPAQIMDPAYAATAFYQHLLALPGWQQMSLNDAAQAVQNSGTPNAYGPHEAAARQIVAAVSGSTCATVPDPSGGPSSGGCPDGTVSNATVLTAIAYACAQLGLPYVWDGSGPAAGDAGFDCSGLTQAAYAAAGLTLPHNAAAQYASTPHVPTARLQPGDLVYYGATAASIHHVGLYLGGGQMIDAPQTGENVQVQPYRWNGDDYYGASRPTGLGAPTL